MSHPLPCPVSTQHVGAALHDRPGRRNLRPLLITLLARLSLLAFPTLFWACDTAQTTRVLHRDSCLTCHTPLAPEDLTRPGLEDAHPGALLTCTDCHGGAPRICDGTLTGSQDDPRCDGTWIYDEALAHVAPAPDDPLVVSDLVAGDLDRVSLAYLRFQNPADLRVVNQTCGRCHLDEAAAVRRSAHATQSGALAIARHRAGLQPDVIPRFGAAPVTDPRPLLDGCTASAITRFDPLLIDIASTDPRTRPSPENTQEQLLVTACIGCHVQDRGPLAVANAGSIGLDGRPTGTHRGSGCASCHWEYAEDGRSASGDPFVDRDTASHPKSHTLVARPSTATCVACHHQGARIGLSFQGLREVTPGQAPDSAVAVPRPLYGLPVGALLFDEDGENGIDETPPDLHFEAGMDCIDCHRGWEVHGDSRLGADRTCATAVTRCEDCHGTPTTEANPALGRHALSRRGDDIVLTTRRTGKTLVVPQVKRSLDPSSPTFSPAAAAMKTPDVHGLAHSDQLACQTCHSGWLPSCYGCHVEHDLGGTTRYLTTGAVVPGDSTHAMLGSTHDDLVLIWDSRGRLAPSMPSERLFFTLYPGDGDAPLFAMAPRSRPDPASPSGRSASYGQRAIDPHTTRRLGPFAACKTCHTSTTDGPDGLPENHRRLDLTHGFGTDRFVVEVCDVTAPPTADTLPCAPGSPSTLVRLDAALDPDGTPAVFIGHGASRPLTLDEIERMRAVRVD